MESRIKKRAQLYAVAAFLSAVVLGAVCYNLGTYPLEPQPPSFSGMLSTFSSYQELKSFLRENSGSQEFSPFYGSWGGLLRPAPSVFGLSALEAYSSQLEYSTTNIQVAGVDEADIVKTDGEYLYLISENDLFIVKAYPPGEAQVVSEITLNHTSPMGIFVDGDRLAVMGSKASASRDLYSSMKTMVCVYDLADRANPVPVRNFTMTGYYFDSRMIGDYIYFVVSQQAQIVNDTVRLPEVYSDERVEMIEPSKIMYFNTSDSYFVFTTIVAINVQNDKQPPTKTTILLGGTSCMYVSTENIYIAFPKAERTVVYRIRIEEENVQAAADGSVPGYLLNQFSMDEHEGYFRIATTTGHIARMVEQATAQNHIYVLNMNLTVVGRLEDLAPGEKIYSARFMGDRGYLVTFRKVDPLFVLDLSQPTNPKVLGKLKIPGYSDYLHPYDENHIIGVGKETVAAEQGDFAWYQGVKISLFDVTDVEDPREIDKYEIGDRGTDSPVLRDHKAFLFDRSKNLLVLPVLVAEIDEQKYPQGVPPNTYGEYVWQGAYVFNLSSTVGFTLKGRITHIENDDLLKSGYNFQSKYEVKRSLYIQNALYTISDRRIKINQLDTLILKKRLDLPK